MPIDVFSAAAGGGASRAPYVSALGKEDYVSPWIDAQNKDGQWELPDFPCEIKGLAEGDPKNRSWRPGEYTDGVDNTDKDEQNQVREWGGQKLWEGRRPPKGWDAKLYPDNVQALLKVPHMPGQPVKEMFARMKALDPRPFEDRHFEEIVRDMVPEWPALLRQARYAEGFGIHTEQEPAEWRGQEEELVPAAYPTPRPDTVTLCVGIAGYDPSQGPATIEIPGAEFDYLELLYAKDQEGKVIQILPFPSYGLQPVTFRTYSFVPPRGTSSITPFACYKIRGVWRGPPIEWDPELHNEEMQWFTDMAPELRAELADRGKLQPASKAVVGAIPFPKSKKTLPVLWPENSWEGNAAKARVWDGMQQ